MFLRRKKKSHEKYLFLYEVKVDKKYFALHFCGVKMEKRKMHILFTKIHFICKNTFNSGIF